MQLATCSRCPGLLPPRASSCPHCGAAVGALSRVKALVAGSAAASSVAITLMACYGMPPCEKTVDADGDGYYVCANGGYYDGIEGPDCDDGDPSIHPGASDLTVDGVDQNCDYTDGPQGTGGGGAGGGGAGGAGGGGAGGAGGGGAGGGGAGGGGAGGAAGGAGGAGGGGMGGAGGN